MICILHDHFLQLLTYRHVFKMFHVLFLYLLSDTLCVNLLSQLEAQLSEALGPLSLSSAAHCVAIGLQHGPLLLRHQKDLTEVTGLALRTGEGLQQGPSYKDLLWKTQSVDLI